MPMGDVLNNSQTQTRTTLFAAAMAVDAVKAFGQTWQVKRFNPIALILDRKPHFKPTKRCWSLMA